MIIKVRLTTFARTDSELLKKFSRRYLGGKNKWRNLEFVTDNNYDRLIILTYPHEQTLEQGYNKDRAVTFLTEPSVSNFVKPHPTSRTMSTHLHLPFLPQAIFGAAKYRGNGKAIKKTHTLSCVISELAGLSGQRSRLEFVYALDQLVEKGIDIYGRPISGKFFNLLKNYQGYLPDKYHGLWPYSYHFACENSFESGYFTEKIIDPLIAESLCFYDGCPDIEKYIDPRAFIKIDVNKIECSIETIIQTIKDNERKKRIKFIRQEKRKFLTELHPFNMIWKAIHDSEVY